LDKPVFSGYNPSEITSNDLIIPWTTLTDTHSAMNGGVYSIPKPGWYLTACDLVMYHVNTTPTTTRASIKVNGTDKGFLNSYSSSICQKAISRVKLMYLEENDNLFISSVTASATHKIVNTEELTGLEIFYLGNNFTTGN